MKIQAEKVIQLVSNKITPTAVKQEMSVSAEDLVVKLDNFSKQFIELPTLKAGQIVEKIMSEINFPPDLKTHVMKNVEFIDVIPILKNIGDVADFDNTVLLPIRKTLQSMMQENVGTEQFVKLESQLLTNIKNLDGSLFPVRNIPHSSQEQLMVFDTPLGKILHNVLVNVPNDVPLQMEVKIADNFLQNEVGVKLKAVVEFLKDRMPKNIEREIKTEDILKVLSKPNEVVKPLAKLIDPLIKNVAYQPMAEIIATKIPGMTPDLLSNL